MASAARSRDADRRLPGVPFLLAWSRLQAVTNDLAPRAFSANLVKIGKLIATIQAPDGVVVTIENIAAQITPEFALEIAGAQVTLLLLAAALEFLGTQSGAINMHPVGQGGSKPTGII